MRPPMQNPIATILPLQYGDWRSHFTTVRQSSADLSKSKACNRCQALSECGAAFGGTLCQNVGRRRCEESGAHERIMLLELCELCAHGRGDACFGGGPPRAGLIAYPRPECGSQVSARRKMPVHRTCRDSGSLGDCLVRDRRRRLLVQHRRRTVENGATGGFSLSVVGRLDLRPWHDSILTGCQYTVNTAATPAIGP